MQPLIGVKKVATTVCGLIYRFRWQATESNQVRQDVQRGWRARNHGVTGVVPTEELGLHPDFRTVAVLPKLVGVDVQVAQPEMEIRPAVRSSRIPDFASNERDRIVDVTTVQFLKQRTWRRP